MMVIGVHGKAGVGKDTFADVLVRQFGMAKRGFAEPLYEEVAKAFGVPVHFLRDRKLKEAPTYGLSLSMSSDHEFVERMTMAGHDWQAPRSPRQVLQLWGTDYRRAQDPRYWIRQMEQFIAEREAQGHRGGVVTPDCRFENEAHCVRAYPQGCVVQILRDVPPVREHVSEKPLPQELIDFRIYNTSLDGLRAAAEYLPMWLAATGQAARNGSEPTVWRC